MAVGPDGVAIRLGDQALEVDGLLPEVAEQADDAEPREIELDGRMQRAADEIAVRVSAELNTIKEAAAAEAARRAAHGDSEYSAHLSSEDVQIG